MDEKSEKPTKRIPVIRSLKLLDDGAKGIFMGSRCAKCGEYFMGKPMFCLKCSSAELAPLELGTKGALRTYTIIYVPPPGWQGQVPYILGAVELPEGIDILTEVIDCPKENVKIGMKMEMVLRVGGKDAEGNEIMVHKWKPLQ